jgi:hypothetical protein
MLLVLAGLLLLAVLLLRCACRIVRYLMQFLQVEQVPEIPRYRTLAACLLVASFLAGLICETASVLWGLVSHAVAFGPFPEAASSVLWSLIFCVVLASQLKGHVGESFRTALLVSGVFALTARIISVSIETAMHIIH